jgi:hypothetical protein
MVASQLRALAAWNLRVKSLLLMNLPYAAEAGVRERRREFCGGRAVSVKKAKGKGKGTAVKQTRTAATKSAPKKKGTDIVQVRENINELVREAAEAIANGVITFAKAGQLASARYLFEATGLYPATEQTAVRPIETTLAHTLLRRMGLPLEPVICDEELAPAVTSDAKGAAAKATEVAEEDPAGERDEEEKTTPPQGE